MNHKSRTRHTITFTVSAGTIYFTRDRPINYVASGKIHILLYKMKAFFFAYHAEMCACVCVDQIWSLFHSQCFTIKCITHTDCGNYMCDLIITERQGKVRTTCLNNPKALNALNAEMIQAMYSVVKVII